MARLWSCGFELQSTADGVEFEASAGNISIDTSVVRSGAASLRCDANGTPAYVDHYVASSDTAHLRVRMYIRLREYPNDVTPFLLAVDSIGVATASIRVNTDGTLVLYDQLSPTGLLSEALDLDTWYCVELWTRSNDSGDLGCEARLNGEVFATDPSLSGGQRWMRLRFGPSPSSANPDPVLDMNFDDIAVNDDSGSDQTGYPGPGSIVHLRPNAEGDNAEFNGNTGGTSGIANNYTRVDELTPDDSTSFNSATVSSILRDFYEVASPTSVGIGASDSITLVSVGCRVGATTSTQGARNIRLLIEGQSGGTVAQSADFYVNVNGWVTHSLTSPFLYQLTRYTNPQGDVSWTPTSLGTMQIGYETVQASTNSRRVSTVWALVEYVPSASEDYIGSAEGNTEASGSASGTSTRTQTSNASTTVSGAADSTKDATQSGTQNTEVDGFATTSSERTGQATLDLVTDGVADGFTGLPPQRGIGDVQVDSEASASTQRIGSATLDTEVSTQSSYQRQSPNTAEGSLEVSSDAYGTKTAQPSLTDAMHMSGLVGADKQEDLVFPIQLHVELDIPGNSWVDITADVRATEPVVITRGRANEAQHPDTSTMTLKLNNRHGKYSPRNPNSPYYGLIGRNTPIRVYVTQGDIVMDRFIGEVSEWPPRWDVSDTDVWINLEASGLLRRLEQGSQPLSSAYKQLVNQSNAVIYWPLDNGPESGFQATSEIGQSDFSFLLRSGALGTTLALTRPPWQDADPAPWLEPMVRTVGVRGLAQGDLDSPLSAPWGVDWIRYGLGGHDGMEFISRDGDTTDRWFVGEDPTVSPRGFYVSIRREIDEGNTSITMLDELDMPAAFLDDNPHHMRFTVEPTSASSLAWTLYGDGVVIASGTRTGTAIRPLVGVRYEWWVPDDGGISQHLAFGQISAFPLEGAHTAAQATNAMRGYNYELAGRRIERLCEEFGVALEVSGDLDDTPVMGPQRIDDFVTLLRQAADVDQGYLMESRQTNALLYRTNRSRYSQEDVS